MKSEDLSPKVTYNQMDKTKVALLRRKHFSWGLREGDV